MFHACVNMLANQVTASQISHSSLLLNEKFFHEIILPLGPPASERVLACNNANLFWAEVHNDITESNAARLHSHATDVKHV